MLVCGYKGEIGSFILSGLLKIMPKTLDIWCVDINKNESEVIKRIQKSDTIFLCIPMDKTADWLWQYRVLLQDKTIIEQTSLKEWLLGGQMTGLDIRSMHILFRPSLTPNPKDRKIALFKNQFDDDIAKKISEMTASEIVWLNGIEEHDREMAIQQALVHRVLLVLGNALEQCHGSTYISQKVIELCERIKSGKLDLYKAIQENKHLNVSLNEFVADFENFKIEDYWQK